MSGDKRIKKIKRPYALIFYSEKRDCFYVKPVLYMNLSGVAIKSFFQEWNIDEFIVVCDDYNLPFGQLRLRRKGSSGGHNGLESIIREMGNSDFNRLRIGIGEPPDGDAIDYVLSPFKPQERKKLDEIINNAVEAIFTYIEKGIDESMNMYNKEKLP